MASNHTKASLACRNTSALMVAWPNPFRSNRASIYRTWIMPPFNRGTLAVSLDHVLGRHQYSRSIQSLQNRCDCLCTIHLKYPQVIADATKAPKLKPDVAIYNLARLGLFRQWRIRHRDRRLQRRAAHRQPAGRHRLSQPRQRISRQGDYARAIADYDASIKFDPKAVFSYQNRGASKQALGDLDGALSDINEAIRLDPTWPRRSTTAP